MQPSIPKQWLKPRAEGQLVITWQSEDALLLMLQIYVQEIGCTTVQIGLRIRPSSSRLLPTGGQTLFRSFQPGMEGTAILGGVPLFSGNQRYTALWKKNSFSRPIESSIPLFKVFDQMHWKAHSRDM